MLLRFHNVICFNFNRKNTKRKNIFNPRMAFIFQIKEDDQQHDRSIRLLFSTRGIAIIFDGEKSNESSLFYNIIYSILDKLARKKKKTNRKTTLLSTQSWTSNTVLDVTSI